MLRLFYLILSRVAEQLYKRLFCYSLLHADCIIMQKRE